MPITSLSRGRRTPPRSATELESSTPTAAFPTPTQPPSERTSRASDSTSRDVQAELICRACATGTLSDLQLALPAGDDAVSLANTPHPRSHLLPLHIAASRGSLAHCSYLLNECGSFVDADDSSGETAIQKAAIKGHSQIVQLLIEKGGLEILESVDNDGWSPLMNASAKGFVDICRILVELGAKEDRKNRYGFTALHCAASGGHALVVRFLLSKRQADPFVRNQNDETPYDVAVANFQGHVADLLESEEAARWRVLHPDSSYNPLALHIAVAVVLHENQRLATGRAFVGSGPTFSSSTLQRPDQRTPFTLPPGGLNPTQQHLPLFRSDVKLPSVDAPFVLPLPATVRSPGMQKTNSSGPSLASPLMSPAPSQRERSHFWVSEWTVDRSSPLCDPEEGWSYASSFDAPSQGWMPMLPQGSSDKVVRYRRWMRVLRRQLDRTLPFADRDDSRTLAFLDIGPPPEGLDYIARAKWLAESVVVEDSEMQAGTTNEAYSRRLMARLEAAIGELRNGSTTEDDFARAQEAGQMLQIFEGRLESLRKELQDVPSSSKLPPVRVDGSPAHLTDYFGDPVAISNGRDHLAQPPGIQVPTRELPSTPLTVPSLPPPTRAAKWVPDEQATACQRCSKRFSVFLRKHHCRMCGRVYCATCSSHTDSIEPTRLVPDPHTVGPTSSAAKHRTCDPCHEELATAAQQLGSPRLSDPRSPLPSIASDISELTECVVCGQSLAPLGRKSEQERHVSNCLERGSGSVAGSDRFIAFRLPSTSPLIGLECDVCLDELCAGQAVARLNCLCSFHEKCARAWLLRGRGCPVHAVRESV